MKKIKILLATKNSHKLNEIKAMLKEYNVEILGINDINKKIEIIENGKTYFENAYKKAKKLHKTTGLITIADDSGLEVEFLNNEPGIYSARYAGENASDKDRINKILKKLKDVPFRKRKAKFVSCIVLLNNKKVYNVTGFVNGYISEKPAGKNGFGYDPIFYLPDLKKCMAQLSPEEKNIISHRANALKRIKNILIEEIGIKKYGQNRRN